MTKNLMSRRIAVKKKISLEIFNRLYIFQGIKELKKLTIDMGDKTLGSALVSFKTFDRTFSKKLTHF